MKDYLIESLLDILEHMGLDGLFDDEQIESIAEDLDGSIDNYGLYMGREAIANPLESEVSSLKNNLKTASTDYEKREREYDEKILELNRYWIRVVEEHKKEIENLSRRLYHEKDHNRD
jgi:seryl-tRNA synthetase